MIKIFCIFVMGLVWGNCQMKAEAITVAHSFLSHLSNNRIMKIKTESWRQIKSSNYHVSNLGFVKSNIKELIPTKNKYGYLIVRIYGDKTKNIPIHRLVAINFVPNPDNKPCVNHKDGDKLNNYYKNLEWCTYSENNKHAYDTGLKKLPRGINHNSSKPIIQLDLHYNIISTFNSMGEAERITGIGQSHISQVCNNKRKTAGGYVWSFSI